MQGLALAMLALAACQPLPHPFADQAPPPHAAILSPRDSAGIHVERIAGVPAAFSDALAESLAAALRDAEIPASTAGANKASYRVLGVAHPARFADGREAIAVDWELRGPNERSLGHATAGIPAADLLAATQETAAHALAEQAAPVIARLVQEEPPAEVGEPRLAIQAVSGAPGDGDRALARAIDGALRRVHVPLVEKPADQASFVLAGTVAVSPPQGGKQQVSVRWALLRPDGKEIGKIDQQNAVPAGSLDHAWGDIAYAVAEAAAPGVAALIEKAKAAETGS
ncbi:MAG TPA: hypothetical protein VGU20_18525 [Stellaceae bacterium]|nr:hypothetical protein [Stellaceae bacterium]